MISNGPTHHKGLNVALAVAGIASVVLAVFIYFENKEHKKIQAQVLDLDRQIKELELKKAKTSV